MRKLSVTLFVMCLSVSSQAAAESAMPQGSATDGVGSASKAAGQLAAIKPLLDIDDDGTADALTDGLLIIRYLFGLRGSSLIANAVGPGANRTTTQAIESQLQGLLGVPPAGFTPGPEGCSFQTIEPNVNLSGYIVDRYGWADANCLKRTAALVRNDAVDPGNSRGGYLRELTLSVGGMPRTVRGTGASGWNGWGYVLNSYSNTFDTSKNKTGTYKTLLAGPHHAIHQFKLTMSPGGPVDVTIHWFFATGRSEPVYAITFDSTPAGPNVVQADSRAPFGELAFEGTAGPIAGLGWGDQYRFTTTGPGPVSVSTPWDYTQANVVPHVRMWSSAVDAEMGAVQTQTFAQQVGGGDYGAGLLAQCQTHTSANAGTNCQASGQTMPQDFLWPFQLNQYELPFANSSHRMGWGSSYGAVGQTTVTAFGRTFSGYPTFRYSVMMAVDAHSTNPTLGAASAIERMTGAQVTGANWNPTYAVWDVPVAANTATVSLAPTAGPIAMPIFRFTGFTATQLSRLTLNDVPLLANEGYFATLDWMTQTLWVTLNGTVTAPSQLKIQ